MAAGHRLRVAARRAPKPTTRGARGDEGALRIAWARRHMAILASIRSRFEEEQPFGGVRIGMALHVEAKTANLALALAAGGADIRLAACNPLSTDDGVAKALAAGRKVAVRAKRDLEEKEYYANLGWVLDFQPHLLLDDGGDLGRLVHTTRRDALRGLRAISEETTTGVMRYRAMHKARELRVPVADANGARMKHLFDNRYGTGQSAWEGILRSTNLLVAGKNVVVAGYGMCGRGLAERARGLGGLVTVTEVDPVRALEARMDGFQVAAMAEACRKADFIVTATGCRDVVDRRHVPHLHDGAVLANAGHFDTEISRAALERDAVQVAEAREGVTAFTQRDGRVLHLLAQGRLVNLAAGQGHPAEIMDMSFAIQALALEWLAKSGRDLKPGVHQIPEALDAEVARLKLSALGLKIDNLTKEQTRYLSGWESGT
jgi:adenosylhomocysteinase